MILIMRQARGLRAASVPTKAKLTYFQDKSLTLQLQYKAEDQWTECFSIEPTPEVPFKMPNTAYLGFSAETGELSDNFDIISVETRNMYSPMGSTFNPQKSRPDPKQRKGGRQRKQKNKGSWSWFFFKIVLFVLVCLGSYVGFTMYRSSKRGSRF